MNALPLNAGVCTERNDAATKLPSRAHRLRGNYGGRRVPVLNRRCEPARVRRVGVLTLNTDLACCWRGRFAFTFLAARSEVVVRNDKRKRITVTM
jgi:hypothetical protein